MGVQIKMGYKHRHFLLLGVYVLWGLKGWWGDKDRIRHTQKNRQTDRQRDKGNQRGMIETETGRDKEKEREYEVGWVGRWRRSGRSWGRKNIIKIIV